MSIIEGIILMNNIHIPFGFNQLVDMAENEKFKSIKPNPVNTNEEMWSHFCWAVLLGGNRTEAEVNYVYGILDEGGMLKRNNLSSDWLVEASDILLDAKDDINDDEDNPEGKISAMNKIKVELSKIETTLKTADEIFEKVTPKIDANYLKIIATCSNPETKIEEENDLIAKIASQDENWYLHSKTTHPFKIPGVAYTKAILWMHGCGIGLDYIPDNNHSVKFLKDCNSKWTKRDFFIINFNFKEVCKMLSTDIYYSGWALWIYQSTKSLINSNTKKQFYNPTKMINIMEENNISINDIADMLGDIDSVECLQEILNEV